MNDGKPSNVAQQEKHEQNPFMKEGYGKIKKHIKNKSRRIPITKNATGLSIVNTETGEIKGDIPPMLWTFTDTEKFAKFFISDQTIFFKLRKPAIRVFLYLAYNIPKNKDKIYFNFNECRKFTQYSTNRSIYQGLSDLIENNVIARGHSSYIYFINPSVFFNGDRSKLLEEFDQASKKEKTKLQMEADEIFKDKKFYCYNNNNREKFIEEFEKMTTKNKLDL